MCQALCGHVLYRESRDRRDDFDTEPKNTTDLIALPEPIQNPILTAPALFSTSSLARLAVTAEER